MTPRKVSVAWNIAAALGVLLLISLLFPSRYVHPIPSQRTQAVNQIKQLSLASRVYATDWDGKYPQTLEALYPDYIDEKELFHTVDEDGNQIPIIFHGASVEDGIGKALLEWPVLIDGRRIVGFTGGHITEMK